MPSTIEILRAIGSTEPRDWGEFLKGLSDRPQQGENKVWAELHGTIGACEGLELIKVTRGGYTSDRRGQIETLRLTELGAERLRESLEEEKVSHRPQTELIKRSYMPYPKLGD